MPAPYPSRLRVRFWRRRCPVNRAASGPLVNSPSRRAARGEPGDGESDQAQRHHAYIEGRHPPERHGQRDRSTAAFEHRLVQRPMQHGKETVRPRWEFGRRSSWRWRRNGVANDENRPPIGWPTLQPFNDRWIRPHEENEEYQKEQRLDQEPCHPEFQQTSAWPGSQHAEV
jgi:hypothetical protein